MKRIFFSQEKILGIFLLGSAAVVAIFFQNCSPITIAEVEKDLKVSCDSSIYSIAVNSTENFYFIQALGQDVSEDIEDVQWALQGALQMGSSVQGNRLNFVCSPGREDLVQAQFLNGCGDEIYLEEEFQPCSQMVENIPPFNQVGDGEDWCVPYVESLSDEDRNHLLDYLASDEYGFSAKYGRSVGRGFTAIEKTFTDQTGRTLGGTVYGDNGVVGPPQYPMLPGQVSGNNYLTLSFSIPSASESNAGAFHMSFSNQTGSQIKEHYAMLTMSPCKGDFRPRSAGVEAETYKRPFCRTHYGINMNSIRGASFPLQAYCDTPANKLMYLNVSIRNMYQGGVPPEDTCPANTYCGVRVQVGIPNSL